ncbi:MAG: tRNA (adenosine(37)-N6)-dimethylallyltransferase MiaA [Chitinispirillia bacterium]|nr:tRNA (adenosine(37)-N6)-dimethylallyltransferase MiaA [Chitinispirillia bacterium]MCL2269248.1 tRNA (adenosine(37)-N6)-dimethylallyltransferase MiaA [Chitinispirillia bacterium]
MEKMTVPVILGPTAVGKTELVLRAAEGLGYEVVSCDSRQIYRRMDVGTAKPTAEERARVRHHLVDILDPSEGYSAFAFADDALRVMRLARESGKKILICGGAGLYYHILVNGTAPLSGSDSVPVREERSPPEDMEFRTVVVNRPRDVLYNRINRRVDAMFWQGLWEEFEALRGMGYAETSPGMICLGYRELFAVERGEVDLARAVELIKQNTRHYAKRQLTWFRNKVEARWIDIDDDCAAGALNGWLASV